MLFVDSLNERVFQAATKSTWQLQIFFKPLETIRYLTSRGAIHLSRK